MSSRPRSRKRKGRKKRRVGFVRSHRDEKPVPPSASRLAREEKQPKEMQKIEGILKDLGRTWEPHLRQVREQAKEVQKGARKATAEHPMLALGVAFFAGMTLGAVLARGKS